MTQKQKHGNSGGSSSLFKSEKGTPRFWVLFTLLVTLYAIIRILWVNWSSLDVMTVVTIVPTIYLIFLVGIAGALLARAVQSQGFGAGGWAAIGMFPIWLWLGGWPRAFLIVGCLFTSVLLVDGLIRLGTGRWLGGDADERRYALAVFIVVVLIGWVAYSAIDLLWLRPLPTVASRAPDQQVWRGKVTAVGVTLSGGGYRAALLHAGVLKELHDRSVPVTHLSTVSGGSIIGMFYTLGHDPESFIRVVSSGSVRLRRRLLNLFEVSQLPLPFTVLGVDMLPVPGRSRIDIQADLLRDIFGHSPRVSELSGKPGTRPWLQLCCTDLTTGSVVGISADGAIMQTLPCGGKVGIDPDRSEGSTRKSTFTANRFRDEDASLLVAASGAFPGAFGALRMHEYVLSDGGLSDNLGGCALEARQKFVNERDQGEARTVRDRWRTDVLIVSDAGTELGKEIDISAIGELPRAMDIVFAGSGWHPSAEHILLNPRDVGGRLEEAFHNAKTLRDSYTEEEAQDLFELGRRMVATRWPDIQAKLDSAVDE